MFEYLYQWMENLAFYMVMITAVMHIIPDKGYQRYLRFFTGLVLIIMLAAPIVKLLGMESSWENLYENDEYLTQIEKIENSTDYLETINPEEYLNEVQKEYQDDNENEEGSEENMEIDVEEIRIGR
ncbi:stage III sporulation protein AF [Lachnospiraceae bacterium HCP28S3_F9]|uniref:stage III sporulation protein AF n=1 Tax=Lachnospiraceae TaxID=186803 RepID=UPI002A7C682D|nr:stage III sporulation protein AF [Lachnospiraceae bacterium]MCI6535343.1 stage III sporulation protein AF [Lachnospiraceae bacterium]MDY2614540.1 stage III sporulation protein AF [Lachnospiraceae bacterium]MDY4206711.1 stage III sporulation protein AF [Lachnospiraceae bacterium]